MIKKNYLKLVLFITAIIVLIIAISIVTKIFVYTLDGSSSGNPELSKLEDPLETELSNMISRARDGEVETIDISIATTFPWDRLFMFGEYTSPSEIDSRVGRSWRNNCYTQIGVSDSFVLLVFVKDDIVVHCLDFPKAKGNVLIPELAQGEGLAPEESRFTVNNYGDLIWIANK